MPAEDVVRLTRSTPPAIRAAGIMTQASATKAAIAVCQPAVLISPWARGEVKTRPSEPAAETAPIAKLCLAGETAREVIAMLRFEPVQASATPISTPIPSVSNRGDVAKMLMRSPSA